jgi:hypothetical protein
VFTGRPDEQCLNQGDAFLTQRKIEMALDMAKSMGHDSIVLSALGCGAYCNPPRHVAQLFRRVLESYDFGFAEVAFAIIDDHNARRAHNPDGNVQPFADVLEKIPRPLVWDEGAMRRHVLDGHTSL